MAPAASTQRLFAVGAREFDALEQAERAMAGARRLVRAITSILTRVRQMSQTSILQVAEADARILSLVQAAEHGRYARDAKKR